MLIGGIIIPIAAMFDPGCAPTGYRCSCRRSRCCRWRSRPWAIKLADMGFQKGYIGELMQRPSETIESLLYVFILAYLVVFARRIREIEREEAARA